MRKAAIIIVVLVGGSVATAGEAVSEINAKFDYLSGNMDSFEGHNLAGSFSVPLSTNFGFQADGLYTHVSDRDFTGAGGHLFWRDWDKGLLGFAAATVHEDGIDAYESGLEAEYYLNKFTLAARLGIAGIEYDGEPVPFIDTDVTDFYAGTEVRCYPLDDLMVSAAWDHVFDNDLLTARFEYLTPIQGG